VSKSSSLRCYSCCLLQCGALPTATTCSCSNSQYLHCDCTPLLQACTLRSSQQLHADTAATTACPEGRSTATTDTLIYTAALYPACTLHGKSHSCSMQMNYSYSNTGHFKIVSTTNSPHLAGHSSEEVVPASSRANCEQYQCVHRTD
jgi:hypothetical protein